MNAFPAPRPNMNINRSVAEARFAFMDNLFLNVWPSKPDGINGSERIANVPDLSATLKRVRGPAQAVPAVLHRGGPDRQLSAHGAVPGVRLSAYVLPDRVLAVVLNQATEGPLSFRYDLAAVDQRPSNLRDDLLRRKRAADRIGRLRSLGHGPHARTSARWRCVF